MNYKEMKRWRHEHNHLWDTTWWAGDIRLDSLTTQMYRLLLPLQGTMLKLNAQARSLSSNGYDEIKGVLSAHL